MKKIILLALVAILAWSCDNENDEVKAPSVTQGTFTDVRDGNTYKTVTIGNQTWMAENLRYRLPRGSYEGCTTYGEIPVTDTIVSNEAIYAVMEKSIPAENPDFGNTSTELGGMFSMFGGMLLYYPFDNVVAMFPMFVFYGFSQAAVDIYSEVYTRHYYLALDECKKVQYISTTTDLEYADECGYLYSFEAAQQAIPDGWRLPTDEDWKTLESYLGVNEKELNMIEEWRGSNQGDFLKNSDGIEFNSPMTGARVWGDFGDFSASDLKYINRYTNTYYWTSTTIHENDSTNYGITRKLQFNNPKIYRGTAMLTDTRFSVRPIKNN